MNPLADFAQRIANLESKVSNMLQTGIVKAIRESDNLVDVEVRGVMLEKVPYLTWRAGSDGKSYWTPEVNESGMLLCPDGQAGNAVFLPALNTSVNPAAKDDVSKIQFDFGNGVVIEIDNGIDLLGDMINTVRNRDGKYELKNTSNVKRTTEHDKIEDEVDGNTIKIDESETEIKRNNNTIKIDGSEIEIKRSSGSVKIAIGAGLTATELEVSATQIKGSIAGVGKILVNAALVNVNGATFLGGATNMVSTVPVTYPPVPIT